MIKALDPSGEGVITINAIGRFERRLSEFKAIDISLLDHISESSVEEAHSGDSAEHLAEQSTVLLRAKSKSANNSVGSAQSIDIKESVTDLAVEHDESDDDIDADLLVNELERLRTEESDVD